MRPLERVDSQSAERGGYQTGRAKLNSDAIAQDRASGSALSLELRGRHRRRIKCEACADWDCPATAGSDLERLVSHQ